jgi:sulfatase maturation enzyme AslB (radical SAM superfamily)
MINQRGFNSLQDLEHSEWNKELITTMESGQWPDECVRCQHSEKAKGESIRTNSIARHKLLHPIKNDYLIVGGVLDNVCNSACQSCNAKLSTKIGSLSSSRNYPLVDNYDLLQTLPLERMLELDVNGGEPTASKNYKRVLSELPVNTKVVRMNTNGSRMIKELEEVLQRNIMVIVTLSLDGTGKIHDYARWPIKWDDYQRTVDSYLKLKEKHKLLHLDFWTTVSCINVTDLNNIIEYTKGKGKHDWAFLETPRVLSVKHTNKLTLGAKHLYPDRIAIEGDNTDALMRFLYNQDTLRKINHRDYLNLE